ncbi:MAG: transposase [Geminicoccaceae bacterium]
MTEDAPFLPGLSPVAGKPVHVAFDGGRMTSDAGVLVLRGDRAQTHALPIGWPGASDPRAPERVHHGLAEMIRFRALMIAAGYEDANDCNALRDDPAFKMAVGRLPEEPAPRTTPQPTMCQLENHRPRPP